MRVSRNILYLFAGILWLVAGVNVIRIGIGVMDDHPSHLFIFLALILLIFLLFSKIVFARVFRQNIKRIDLLEENEIHFWKFMDRKGYIIMLFMISLGIIVRHFHLLSDFFISFFYIGLGAALSLTAFKYLYHYFKK
ncbi:MAG: hypothetical protein ACRC9Q_02410 [Bacteroidales bacterium]